MNRMRTLGVLAVAFFLVVLAALPAAAGGNLEKQCEAEIRKAGFDPLAFTGGISVGDEGNDDFGDLAADEAACGFGGDDEVGTNRGLFIGGNGDDTITTLTDGTFNGGNGDDTVTTFTSGTCIDVEVGCP